MLDTESMIKAKRVICLKNLWKTIKVVGRQFSPSSFRQLGDALSCTVILTPLISRSSYQRIIRNVLMRGGS